MAGLRISICMIWIHKLYDYICPFNENNWIYFTFTVLSQRLIDLLFNLFEDVNLRKSVFKLKWAIFWCIHNFIFYRKDTKFQLFIIKNPWNEWWEVSYYTNTRRFDYSWMNCALYFENFRSNWIYKCTVGSVLVAYQQQ